MTRSPRRQGRGGLAPLALALCLAAAGCAPPPHPLARGAGPAAVQAELDALEDRGEGVADGEALSRLGFLRYFLEGDVPGALRALDAAAARADASPLTLLRHLSVSVAAGRVGAAAEDAARLLDTAPGAPETDLALRLASDVSDESPHHDAVLGPALRRYLEGPGGDPVLWFHAAGELRSIAERRGEQGALAAAYARRGALQRWATSSGWGRHPADQWLLDLPPTRPGGPFHDADHPLVERATSRATIEFPVRGGGVHFAWTYVYLDAPADLMAALGASDSARMEIDGVPVATLDRWERHEPATAWRAVRLPAGWHRVLVRVAHGRDGAWFHAYLTGGDGPPPAWRNEVHLPPGAVLGEARRVWTSGSEPANSSYSRWRAVAGREGADPEGLYWLARFQVASGSGFSGKDAATRLLDRWPEAPGALEAAALAWGADASLPHEWRRTREGSLWRRLLSAAPAHAAAACALAGVERESGDAEGALRTLDAALGRGVEAPCLRTSRAARHLSRKWPGEARADVEALEALAPGSRAALRARLDWSRSHDRAREPAARDALLAALGRTRHRTVAQELERAGRTEEALALLREIRDLEPHRPGPLAELHDALVRAGRSEEAGQVRGRMRTLFPDDPRGHAEEARAALARGDGAAAKEAAGRALALDPTRDDLQDLWALAAGDPSLWRPSFDAAEEVRRAEADPRDLSAWPWVVVRQRREVRVLPGGAAERRFERLVRVQSKGAVDRFGEQEARRGERLVRVASYKPDGRAVEPDDPGTGRQTLRDLEVGDYVYVAVLEVEAPSRNGAGGFHLGGVEYPTAPDAWTMLSEERVSFPKAEPGRLWKPPWGGKGWRAERGADGGIAYARVTRDVPAPPEEAYAPPRFDRDDWSLAASALDAGDLLAARRAAFRTATRVNVEVQRQADALRVAGDPQATARAVHAWVAENVEGSGAGERFFGSDAARTLVERRGNATALEAALLRAAGVGFELLGARSRLAAHPDPAVPAEDYYPLPVLRVSSPGGGETWLVPSTRSHPAGWIPPSHRGGPAARIFPAPPPEASPFGTLPDLEGPVPSLDLAFDLALGGDGSVEGSAEVTLFQHAERVFREAFWDLPPDRQQALLEQWWNALVPGIEVAGVERLDGAGRADPIRFRAVVSAREVFQPAPAIAPAATGGEEGGDPATALAAPAFWRGLPTLPDPQAVDLGAALVGESRTLPLQTAEFRRRLVLRLRGVPPGSESAWPEVDFRSDHVDLLQSSRHEDGVLVVVRELDTRLGRTSPAAYPAFRRDLARALSATALPVRLPSPTGAASAPQPSPN